jgi:hypothetical protein
LEISKNDFIRLKLTKIEIISQNISRKNLFLANSIFRGSLVTEVIKKIIAIRSNFTSSGGYALYRLISPFCP